MQKAQGYESSLEAERQAGQVWKSLGSEEESSITNALFLEIKVQAIQNPVIHDSKGKGPMIAGRSLRKES